jgi:hypothetical protein
MDNLTLTALLKNEEMFEVYESIGGLLYKPKPGVHFIYKDIYTTSFRLNASNMRTTIAVQLITGQVFTLNVGDTSLQMVTSLTPVMLG